MENATSLRVSEDIRARLARASSHMGRTVKELTHTALEVLLETLEEEQPGVTTQAPTCPAARRGPGRPPRM